VGIHLLGTSLWQGHLWLWRWREGLDLTLPCHCTSDLLPAYCVKIPLTKSHALYYIFVSAELQDVLM